MAAAASRLQGAVEPEDAKHPRLDGREGGDIDRPNVGRQAVVDRFRQRQLPLALLRRLRRRRGAFEPQQGEFPIHRIGN